MKIAIVGCGGMGNVHANSYLNIPGVTVVGVHDIISDLSEKLANLTGATVYDSYDAMLEQSGCDIVSVTLPSHLHMAFSIRAAEAGKHVICEKPIALTLEDARVMIDVCQQQNVHLFVGHVVRFFPEYNEMRNKIQDNSLGRIGVAHAKRIGAHPGTLRQWFIDDQLSGGVVIDLMVHDLDFMRWSIGEVRSVYGLRTVHGMVDYASATLVFDNDAVANIESYWGYPGSFTTAAEIAGSKGLVQHDSSNNKSIKVVRTTTDVEKGPFVEVPQSPGYVSPYQLELEHFIDCIRNGSEPIVSAEDAYKALEIGLAVMESVNTGQTVYLAKGGAHNE
ncbi:Gfo/Idh/MocA family protein [Paenibacillus yanchengensis]|uniref:Gfo/Idh/MocA family protein n=1 Tax=Paenibacillus yanchengensis TaxID=2035833 RepID=A0ABW4YID0_9BACL